MRTISRRIRADRPHGDHRALCDYCGIEWMRSRLRRDRAGLLRCPDEGDGKDVVTLAEGNARGAQRKPTHRKETGRRDLSNPINVITVYIDSADEM